MNFFDKIMKIMRLEDDEYYDENEDIFEMDEEEEKPQRKTFLNRRKAAEEEEEDFAAEKKVRPSRPAATNKITPMMRPSSKKNTGMEVCVIKPTVVDDAREIADTLLTGRTVILNFEGLDLEIAQRIIDFTSGATFSIDGNLQKISNFIFLVTPTNVDISGDLQDLFNSSSFNLHL